MSLSVPNESRDDDVPAAVARAMDIMSTFSRSWFLCGGWAVDAWLGRQTREHKDVDIAIFEDDLDAMLTHFAGRELIAHDAVEPDSTEPWLDRPLYLPAHIHARLANDFELDFQVNKRSGREWVLSNEQRIVIHLDEVVADTSWGVPAVALQALLFYKAQDRRPQDEADFNSLRPSLNEVQRHWLREAIGRVQPDHPWLARLGGS